MSESDTIKVEKSIEEQKNAFYRSLVVLLIVAVTYWGCQWTPEVKGETKPGVTVRLPDKVGLFWGIDAEITQAERLGLPKDTQFARKTYNNGMGDEILSTIILSGAEKRSIHRPEVCLDGQGWDIRAGDTTVIPMEGGGEFKSMILRLNRLATTQDGTKVSVNALFLYWFVGQDRMTPYHWERLFLTSWDRVTERINHRWAFIIAHSLITENLRPHGKTEAETLQMLREFLGAAAPQYLSPEVLKKAREKSNGL